MSLPLIKQVRRAGWLRHCSIRTEEAYVNVIRRFNIYPRTSHPNELSVDEIRRNWFRLATDKHVAASTQNDAERRALLALWNAYGWESKYLGFNYSQIIVRGGKGVKDRRTLLQQQLAETLRHHLAKIHLQHEEDMRAGYGSAP